MLRHFYAPIAALLFGLVFALSVHGEGLGDVKFKRAESGGMEIPPAVFPHSMHRVGYKCAACHDVLFPMKAGSSKFTMDAIQEGKSCGTCHNGKLAFASTFATCPRCHRE
jgi:c(7)-type cytochrome triheme protein